MNVGMGEDENNEMDSKKKMKTEMKEEISRELVEHSLASI